MSSGLLYGSRSFERTNEAHVRERQARGRRRRRETSADLQRRRREFAEAGLRQAGCRGFEHKKRGYCWTTTRWGEQDRFVSFEVAITKGGVLRVLRSTVRFHAKRKDAKARAWAAYEASQGE